MDHHTLGDAYRLAVEAGCDRVLRCTPDRYNPTCVEGTIAQACSTADCDAPYDADAWTALQECVQILEQEPCGAATACAP